MRVQAGKVLAVVAGAVALLVLCASTASAQEAPICTKWKDHLKPGDNFHLGDGNASVIGPESNDHIFGEGGKDLINGGRGNDVIEGGPGNDILCGGRGNDTIIGGPGNDKIYGEEENDTIIGGPGNDTVQGSAGDDRIEGYGTKHGEIVDDGVDTLDGGFNDDTIIAGGADTLLGYTHDDVLSTKTPDVAPKLMSGGGNDDIDLWLGRRRQDPRRRERRQDLRGRRQRRHRWRDRHGYLRRRRRQGPRDRLRERTEYPAGPAAVRLLAPSAGFQRASLCTQTMVSGADPRTVRPECR